MTTGRDLQRCCERPTIGQVGRPARGLGQAVSHRHPLAPLSLGQELILLPL
jgi:hypothetical protein